MDIQSQFKSTLDSEVPRIYYRNFANHVAFLPIIAALNHVPQSYKYYLLELETDHVSQTVFEMCDAHCSRILFYGLKICIRFSFKNKFLLYFMKH